MRAFSLKRVLLRTLGYLINTMLWLGLWLVLFLILFMLLLFLRDAPFFNAIPSGWQRTVELFIRSMIAVPFLLWVVLLIHPVRMRWWILNGLLRFVRLLTRHKVTDPTTNNVRDQTTQVFASQPEPISRRRFFVESALIGGTVGYGMLIEPELLQILRSDLPIRGLPSRFDGFTIAQVSDLHVNAYTTSDDIDRAVAAINRLQPDLVVITGDFVDWQAKYTEAATQPFRAIKASEGVFSVLGNHDYYTGNVEAVKSVIRRYDLGLLVNQHTVLRRGPDRLTLVGLDDPRHNRGPDRYSYESINPQKALQGASNTDARLTLLHNPVLIPELVRRYRLDAVLSGHTHGGQFQVPIVTDTIIKAREYFVHGHYDLGHTQVYVNRGLGFTGPPIRFRAAPEVTLLRLVAAS